MSRNRIIAFAGLVCVAVLFFFWLRGRGGDEAAKRADGVEETSAAKPSRMAADKPEAKSGERRNGELDVLFDDDPEGSLRLEGQVLAAGDLPVGGAIVAINSRPPRFTKSEEDGSFFFDKLVGRTYELVARADQGVGGPVSARLSETNEPVILSLIAGGQVSVTVKTADKPDGIAGANVELRGIDLQSAITDQNGTATFTQVAVDRYEVMAKAEGYAPARSRVSLSRAGAHADLQLLLKNGARVAGIVVDHEGKAVEGARVIFNGASDWSLRANARFDGVLSDAKGLFAIDALPAGSFRFTATADGYAPGSSPLVSLDGANETTGVEVRMAEASILRGHVVSKTGDPIPAARVRVGAQSAGMVRRRAGLREVYTDDKGAYELTGLPRKVHDVIAMHESASSEIHQADLSLSPYETDLEIRLDVDGMISGTVVDSNDEPIAGAQVMVFPDFRKGSRRTSADWRMRGMNTELTDSGGSFEVGGLKPDEDYRVRAIPGSSGNPGRAWLVEGVEARTGDKEVRIVLPADGGIKGKVAFANGEAPDLFTVSVGWRRGTPFSSKDGSFELGEMPPQNFTVSVEGKGFDKRLVADVEVKEGKFTDLGTITVTKGRAVTGKVLDGNGAAVEGASVSAGRVLFGDGSSAKSNARARNPMARGTKTVSSDENGEFSISGVGMGDLSVVADHETIGRSLPFTLQQSKESIEGLQLVLQATGALEGVVRKDGVPESDVVLVATSIRAPGVTFNVASGQDGSYRFDRLVPDTYRVKAMFGGNPMAGMSFYAEQVDILAGQSGKLDIDFQAGGTTLTLSLAAEGDLGFSRFSIVSGIVQGASARELEASIGVSTGFEGFSMSIRGMPGTARNLTPGPHTVCAIVFPSEVEGMAGTMEYMQREGDNLPAQCQRVEIGEGPTQALEMKVVIPEYVTPPSSPPSAPEE